MSRDSSPPEPGRALTVNEGVALMQAWCRYLGVDDYTTVVVPPDFQAGFLAARRVPPADVEKVAKVLQQTSYAGSIETWRVRARAALEALGLEVADA